MFRKILHLDQPFFIFLLVLIVLYYKLFLNKLVMYVKAELLKDTKLTRLELWESFIKYKIITTCSTLPFAMFL